MQGLPVFNPRSDALKRRDEPGKGDDVPCVKCGGALDTGLECTECGHDNHEAVTGKPFTRSGAVIDMNAAHKTAPTDAIRAGAKEPSDG